MELLKTSRYVAGLVPLGVMAIVVGCAQDHDPTAASSPDFARQPQWQATLTGELPLPGESRKLLFSKTVPLSGGSPFGRPDLAEIMAAAGGFRDLRSFAAGATVGVDSEGREGAVELARLLSQRHRGARRPTVQRPVPPYAGPMPSGAAEVTPEQSAAQLAHLRADYDERRLDDDRLRFTRDLGSAGTLEVEFSERHGAIVRSGRTDAGTVRSVTVWEYVQTAGGTRLIGWQTSLYDEDGDERAQYDVAINPATNGGR